MIVFFAAAAAGGLSPQGAPDIAVKATVRAREVRIEQQGRAQIRVWAEPSAGDKVAVERNLPKGQRTYRNLQIGLDAEARLAAPADRTPSQQPSTGEP